MLKSFKNGIILGFIFVSFLGVVFATQQAIFSVEDIQTKESNGLVTIDDFNNIIGTLKNIYNKEESGKYFIGIGTGSEDLTHALEVQGGAIKATNGLIIETRDSEPTNLYDGRIWLRTDI